MNQPAHLDPPALEYAITIWRRGDPIPLDLEADLMALGMDVPALEARYRA